MERFSGVVVKLADAVEDAANAVGEFASDIAETVGNGVEDGLTLLGGSIPGLSNVLGWIGGVISGALDLVGVIIKSLPGIVGGVIGGLIRITGGIVNLDLGLILQGLGDIFSSITGALILFGVKLIVLVQQIILAQAKERKLSDDETTFLKKIFGESIAFYNVRLIEGKAGVFGINNTPFALGNTIYLKNRNVTTEPELLVHECTHVWQYQNLGSRYSSDALYAQQCVKDEYSWEAEIERGNERWLDFNKEAQAAFLEDIYTHGKLLSGGIVTAKENGVFYDADNKETEGQFLFNGVDHTQRANEAMIAVRNDKSQRLSS